MCLCPGSWVWLNIFARVLNPKALLFHHWHVGGWHSKKNLFVIWTARRGICIAVKRKTIKSPCCGWINICNFVFMGVLVREWETSCPTSTCCHCQQWVTVLAVYCKHFSFVAQWLWGSYSFLNASAFSVAFSITSECSFWQIAKFTSFSEDLKFGKEPFEYLKCLPGFCFVSCLLLIVCKDAAHLCWWEMCS